MREVGLRKVVGAKRAQLIYQFLGESVLLSLFSFVLALGLTELTLPILNGFMQINLSITPMLLPILFILAMGVGLLAGSYCGDLPEDWRCSLFMIAPEKGGGRCTLSLQAVQVSLDRV